MRYLKTYQDHNEGFKKGLVGAGLAASLLMGSPTVTGKDDIQTTQTQQDETSKMKDHIAKLSLIRKNQPVKDQKLSDMLDSIESGVSGGDTSQLHSLFLELSGHLKDKYGYEIKSQDIKLDQEKIKSMNIFMILGWLGSLCLAICGVPQAWQSHKDKHSHGISWGFLLLWAFGEVFAGAYVWDKVDAPLLINYSINILIVAVILYYKRYPNVDNEEETTKPE